MNLLSTPAIILSTLRYAETSKIVRLATREWGVQSAIAKGALRPRSRFGAALQILSEGQAHLLHSPRRELQTLTAFDVQLVRVGLSDDLHRFAAATVLAELMLRLSPAEPHPEGYEVLRLGLASLDQASAESVASVGLGAIWRLVAALGFAPVLDECVRDGRALEAAGETAFSIADGGSLCSGCARGEEHPRLPPEARAAVSAMVAGRPAPLPDDERHRAAHRRLLARYIRYHVAEEAVLPALDFWHRGGGPGGGR